MGLTTEASDLVLVQSAVDLGHNLGLLVVAEGVEDEATQTMLAAMGCDDIQGYFVTRPLPSERFAAWLDNYAHKATKSPSAQVRHEIDTVHGAVEAITATSSACARPAALQPEPDTRLSTRATGGRRWNAPPIADLTW